MNHSVKEAGEWRNWFKEISLMKGMRIQNCYCWYVVGIAVFSNYL